METSHNNRELVLLEQIEHDPDVTQASLAVQLGVAIGTVNLLIKNLVEKGYIKAKRAQRKKLRYIITPAGITLRARLTVNYIENSMDLYRRTRKRVNELIVDIRAMGYDEIRLVGDGDIAEICRLTCLEQGIKIADNLDLPTLEIRGWKVYLMENEKA